MNYLIKFFSSLKLALWATLLFSGTISAQQAENLLENLRYDHMVAHQQQLAEFSASFSDDLESVLAESEQTAAFSLKKQFGIGNAVKRKGRKLEAVVDLSRQRMTVYVDGDRIHKWVISSGRMGHRTPVGSYKPTRMYRKYYSKTYDNAPMPNSVFFYKGYAIHGSYALWSFGRPGSHGCIRLTPIHGRKFYNLVQAHGKANTKIRIVR